MRAAHTTMYKDIEKILSPDIIRYDEPLKAHCTFKIGGAADILVTPKNIGQLKETVSYARERGIRTVIIGNGSNVLFSDKGVRGMVIEIGPGLGGAEVHSADCEYAVIRAGAGALLSRISSLARDGSLTGLEFACGIPGSVGGAVLMNAGAYDGEISMYVTESSYLDTDTSEIHTKKGDEHAFSYRYSSYQNENVIILSADFKLKRGDKDGICEKMRLLTEKRKSKQPLEFPSAGSAFKRPADGYAAKLIEECGLKGYTAGGAQVSDKHCGFIINRGGASCDDVLHVIEYVQNTVFRLTGTVLEPEIRVIGER